jgi:RNA polymerase sigma-70 factor (ECF subfamily)
LTNRAEREDRTLGLLAGDPGSWEAFYREIYPAMVAFAQRRLGTAEDARDAVSEAMTRAVGTLGRVESDESVTAWCFGILRHVVLDAQRRSYRHNAFAPDGEIPGSSPDEHVILEQEHSSVRAAFSRLDARERDLLELRVVAGLSSEEVARIMGMRPGAVRMAQARALARLRTMLSGGS